MTDPLLAALVADDERAVADVIRSWPEARRKARATELSRIARAMDEHSHFLLQPDGKVQVFEHGHAGYHHSFRQQGAVRLAMIGTASLPQLRRLGAWGVAFMDAELVAGVLLDRRPPWLASWAAWMLAAETWSSPWRQVQALVRAGAIDRPPLRARAGGRRSAPRSTTATWRAGGCWTSCCRSSRRTSPRTVPPGTRRPGARSR